VLRIPQGLIHRVLQAADPTIERKHEPAFGPLGQRWIEAAQADAPQYGLPA
jgi:hypothetical protein